MGYTTEFKGIGFWTEPPLRPEHRAYINAFAERRHMTLRTDEIAAGPTRTAVGLDAGELGVNVVGDDIHVSTGRPLGDSGGDGCVLGGNSPPPGVPGLWCQWVVDETGHINWDGGEKFYNYEEWLAFLMERYLGPWGYVLNGFIDYQGEDGDDFGRIIVANNELRNVFQWRGE